MQEQVHLAGDGFIGSKLTARLATAAFEGASTRALLAAKTISTIVVVFPGHEKEINRWYW